MRVIDCTRTPRSRGATDWRTRAGLVLAWLAVTGAGCTASTHTRSVAELAPAAQAAAAGLTSESREALLAAPVPLYLFGASAAANTVVTSEPGSSGWAAASFTEGGVTLFTQTNSHWVEPDPEEVPVQVPTEPLVVAGTTVDALFQENEEILSFAWVEGDRAFVLEVECEDREDARCASREHLASVAASLVRVVPQGVTP